jgi:hypothetical protein
MLARGGELEALLARNVREGLNITREQLVRRGR